DEDFDNLSLLMATGSPYAPHFDQIRKVDWLKLPGIRKLGPEHYSSRVLDMSGRSVIRWRAALLKETASRWKPDVLLVDKAPVGVNGELIPALRWIRRHRPATRLVFGMRDIEDEPAQTIRQWSRLGVQRALESCYQEILVYGMRKVFDVASEYQLSPGIARKLQYLGYICRGECDHRPRLARRPQVLLTVGGGTDGHHLIDTYLHDAARRVTAAGLQTLIVGGPDLPAEEADRLRSWALGVPGVRWEDHAPCLYCHLLESRAVVAMGGYNTMTKIAALRVPALIVPRSGPRKEQEIRARLWHKLGLVDWISPAGLTPARLADRVVDLVRKPAGEADHPIDLGGLDRVSQRLRSLTQVTRESEIAPPVCL
ncbi:MAG: hypothetical protein OER86_08920, partial [Phycisphaerae bacterium]|nr:hypothetical protein [Phycisphaerae bacterium]